MLFIRSFFHDDGKVKPDYEGHNLRTAYLLADIAVAAGTSYTSIDFENYFRPTLPQKFKRITIEAVCEQLNPPFPLTDFRQFYREMQEIKAVKHKNKQVIILEKNAEKLFEGLYSGCVAYMREGNKRTGLADLLPLWKSEELYIHGSNSTEPESSEGHCMPYSEMLNEKWTVDDELYIVSYPFNEYLKEKTEGLPETEADSILGGFSLGTLPILNYFTLPELRIIREQVFGGAGEMRKRIEEWSAELKKERFVPNDFGAYEKFFFQNIQPHKLELEERINDCETLRKFDSFYRGQAGSENKLCITAAKTLWDYFEWSGSVPAESMKKFRSNLPEGCHEDTAVPFILCANFNKLDNIYEDSDKKSLEL